MTAVENIYMYCIKLQNVILNRLPIYNIVIIIQTITDAFVALLCGIYYYCEKQREVDDLTRPRFSTL